MSHPLKLEKVMWVVIYCVVQNGYMASTSLNPISIALRFGYHVLIGAMISI